ncbi:toll/interleukin-1 receptor domain-containing protein [Streptomyces mayteni]
MRYAAFISYSHAADSQRAQRLRQALHRFARPWTRRSALRVFLDNAALSADPGLWSTVEGALGDSEFLILLASPEAARSEWVGREISWWRAGPRSRNLLLVVTGGELHWDHGTGDFDWQRTTCLHPAMRGHFSEEPRWVDLRWMGEEHSGELRDPRFLECVADLAAPLHARPKDELIGEDVSQHRRLRRFRRIMWTGLTLLTAAALTAASIAVVQWNSAQDRARLATARQLAATALNLSADDLEVASLLAIQAHQVRETPETLSALYQLATGSPQLVRFVRADANVTALAHTTTPLFVAAGTEEGSVTLWTANGDRTEGRFSLSGQVTSLRFSDDGQLLAAGTDSGQVAVYDVGTGTTRDLSASADSVSALAFRPGGHDLAVMDGGMLRLYEAGADTPSAQVDTGLGGALSLAFRHEGSELALISGAGWRRYDEGLNTLGSSDGASFFPSGSVVPVVSPSGECSGYAAYGGVALVSTTRLFQGAFADYGDDEDGCGPRPSLPGKEATSAAVSDDGRVAVGTSQGLLLATTRGGEQDGGEGSGQTVLDTLPGVETPSVLAFPPIEGDRLASADGSTVALWFLESAGPTVDRYGLSVPDNAMIASSPPLAVAPDGEIAWSHEGDLDENTLHLSLEGNDLQGGTPGVLYGGLALSPDRERLYAATGTEVEVWAKGSDALFLDRTLTIPGASDPHDVTRLATRPDGTLVVLAADASVQLIDPGTGETTVAVAPAPADPDQGWSGPPPITAALSENGGLAAIASPDGRVDVHELPSGRRLQQLDLGGSSLDSLALSETGRSLFAVTDGRELRRWDVDSGALRWRSDGAGPAGLAADPGGRWAATMAGDGTVWLWDVRTGDRLGSTLLPSVRSWARSAGPGSQSSLAFSLDGELLWSASEGGELLTWDTSVDAWIESICERVGRRLTDAERDRYLTSVARGHTACDQ